MQGPRRGPDKTALNVLLQRPHHHTGPQKGSRGQCTTERTGSWTMMLARRAGIALIVGMMLIDPVAASTKAHSQPSAHGRDTPNVFDGVLSDVAGSSEISTAQLKAALTSSAIALDARPYDEYAVSHIPGARAVPAKA